MNTNTRLRAEPPPSYYQSGEGARSASETTPLISNTNTPSQKRTRDVRIHLIYIAVISIIIVYATFIGLYLASNNDPLCERARGQVRKQWEREKYQHEKEVLHWKNEIVGYEQRKLELLIWIERLEEGARSKEAEVEVLDRRVRQLQMNARRAESREREALERLEEYRSNLQKEQEERAKMRLYWDDLLSDDRCRAHGEIHYRAFLRNVLPMIDAVEACRATPITINGVEYHSPDWCEDVGNSNIYGHWIVKNDRRCTSYWDYFRDKGCVAPGSRLRRFESPLAGVDGGQDLTLICLTTPATILGQDLAGPTSCPNWGPHGFWGIWNVHDDNCA